MASRDYARIEQAIGFIRRNLRQQPDLGAVAAHVGLSPFHFQRLFLRWAGVSPKRFLQFLSVEHAKRTLRSSKSILEAAFRTGLSGPGRLHDLFVSVEAVTPGEYKSGGAGLEIAFGEHDSPFGRCFLATTERGICRLEFAVGGARGTAQDRLAADWPAARIVERLSVTAPLVERVFAGASGNADCRPLGVLLKGTNFQVKVWSALLRIPPGAVTTYQDLAAAIGRPGAARAVGQAVGANRVACLIPCHRILRGTGESGGYRWGTERKLALLGCEQAWSSAPT